MSRQRRHFTPEQKVALLREHLLDKVPISDLCEKHGIAVNNFYHWQKQFFDNGRIVGKFVEHYNTVRLHSALGYITPKDQLEGRAKQLHEARDRKLEAARERRKEKRQQAHEATLDGQPANATT